jgi:uncharacterized protein YifE (UPF0438 family)
MWWVYFLPRLHNNSQIDEPLLVPTTSREEEDLANYPIMLASSSCDMQRQAIVDVHQQPYVSTSKGERAPASKDEQRFLGLCLTLRLVVVGLGASK